MSGEELAHVDQQTYLGVELTQDLNWGPHIQKVVTKANRNLNMVRRNLSKCTTKIKCQAYLSLVRPSLEYVQTVWDPYQQKHIEQVEKIQRKAVRFVMGNYDRTASVTSMREKLEWPTLQQRRCVTRLTMFHKTQNNQSAVNIPDYIQKPSRIVRGQHNQSYINIQSSTNVYQFSYFPRTIRCWNLLPVHLVQIPTHTAFQQGLWSLINSGQITVNRPRDPNFRSRLGGCSQQQQPIVIY